MSEIWTGQAIGQTEIGATINQVWVCRTCNHRQEPVENEEWPFHCGGTMRLGHTYRLIGREAV